MEKIHLLSLLGYLYVQSTLASNCYQQMNYEKLYGYKYDINCNNLNETNIEELQGIIIKTKESAENRPTSHLKPTSQSPIRNYANDDDSTATIRTTIKHRQRNAQKEMDNVIGRGRLPSLEDRARLPYVESIILESLRMFAGRGFLVPRRAMKDSTLNGYFIPKGTFIQANSGGTLLDEGAGWKNPKTFEPERFMKDGALNIPDNFILFGLGKRRCLGDTLARANIFLIVASLLHMFHFKPAPGSPPALQIVESFTPSLKPFKAFVTLRQPFGFNSS